MNEKQNHFQQYLPQTEVALIAEIAAVLNFAPQSLDAVWVAVPWLQEALAPAMPTQSSLQAVSCVAVATGVPKDQEKSSEHKAY